MNELSSLNIGKLYNFIYQLDSLNFCPFYFSIQ